MSPSALLIVLGAFVGCATVAAQSYTSGFQNTARPEPPGTLLSHPDDNDSRGAGRTTNLMIHGGWLMTGSEAPGSQPGADMEFRVYNIEDPENPVRMHPSDFGLNYDNDVWYRGNWGYHTHGHYQSRTTLQPNPVFVNEAGGAVFRGNPDPQESQAWDSSGFGRGRGARQTPWGASDDWAYGDDEDTHYVTKLIFEDTVGDWSAHNTRNVPIAQYPGGPDGVRGFPIVFGDRLILLSDQRNSGLAIYRIPFERLEDIDSSDPLPQPALLGVLNEPLGGYWPELYADAGRLYAVFTESDSVQVADITDPLNPVVVRDFFLDGARNATYPKFQDNLLMIHDWVINMDRLISGHSDPVDLVLDVASVEETAQYPGRLDTSQFTLPLGNLLVTGGYGGSSGEGGMAIWVRQQAPDTTPPRVGFHVPEVNRTNYPRFAPLSFVIHETLDHFRLDPMTHFTLRKVNEDESLGVPVDGLLVFGSGNVLTFTPHFPLDEDSSYQVDFHSDPAMELGFRDVAGNTIEPYSFRFSTGSLGLSNPPPEIESFTASSTRISPGATIDFALSVSDPGDTLAYRFNPGDGEGWGDWQSSSSFSSPYAEEGRYTASVQVRDSAGNVATASERLLVIDPPLAGSPGIAAPTQSSSIIRASDGRIWTVNPDSDSVAVLDGASGAKLAEYLVGADPRSLAEDANGLIWVTCFDDDSIYILNATPADPAEAVSQIIDLSYGDAPYGVCPSPDGTVMYVSLYGAGGLLSLNTSTFAQSYRTLASTLRAVAVNGAGDKVYATRFISAQNEAEIWRINSAAGVLGGTRKIALEYGFEDDRGDRGAGIPNYLSSITLSPDGRFAVITAIQANVFRGIAFGTPDLSHENTVRAILLSVDLDDEREVGRSYTSRLDIDNSDSPSAVRFSPDGDVLAVTLQGNNQVVLLDGLSLGTEEVMITPVPLRAGVGFAPQGLVFEPSSNRLFVQNLMSRSVSVLDASPVLEGALFSLPHLGETVTADVENMAPEIRLGKQIFYDASDPRMSAESYISCASCHIDGGTDERIWDFTGRGEGFRRTPSLRGRGGMAHGNVHWSGNFDEIQDFEHDIRGPFGGEGFIVDPDFESNHPGPSSVKAGLSPELDALAAYVSSLDQGSLPKSPFRSPDGELTPSAVAGKMLFDAMDCRSCHAGDELTNSPLTGISSPVLSNVGTLTGFSGQRLGAGPLEGVDVPTLLGLFENSVYLHHGQAKSLQEVFEFTGGRLYEAENAQPVYSNESGAVSERTKDQDEGGGGGWSIHAISGGRLMVASADEPASETGVRFTNVDGGSGGAGQIRVKASYGRWNPRDVVLRVNGVSQRTNAPSTPISSGMTDLPWISFDVTLAAGLNNTVEVLRPADISSGGLSIDAISVSTPEDISAAAPHQIVQTLSEAERESLEVYLLSLDGGPEPEPLLNPESTGTLTREYWTGIPGGDLLSLTSHPAYPDSPSGTDSLTRFEAVSWADSSRTNGFGDDYGQRIRGYIVPILTGSYTFWIAGDDESVLLLAHDDDPANATEIALVSNWSGQNEFDRDPSQKSSPVVLQAGVPYYVEVLHKEGGGGDHVSVAWTTDPLAIPTASDIIPGNVLSAYDVASPEPFTHADEDWLNENGGDSALLAPPSFWLADTDSDGRLNLFEFLHGTDPHGAENHSPMTLTSAPNGGSPIFTFDLVSDTGRIDVVVQVSPDLVNWSEVPRESWQFVSSSSGVDQWQIAMDAGVDGRCFVRLWAE